MKLNKITVWHNIPILMLTTISPFIFGQEVPIPTISPHHSSKISIKLPSFLKSPQQERPTKKPKVNPRIEECEVMGNYVGKLPLVIKLLKTIHQPNTQLNPNIKTPTKLIVYGDSGNGKSVLIESLAKEINGSLITLEGYDFIKYFENLTPSPDITELLKNKFQELRCQHAILSGVCIFWFKGGFDRFIDKLKYPENIVKTIEEIRAVFGAGKKTLFIAEQQSIPNQFLKTNFDTLRLDFPDFNTRYNLLQFFAQRILSTPIVLQKKQWEMLANKTDKLVGSEIQRIVNYAAISICMGRTTPTQEDKHKEENKELSRQEECFLEVVESQCKELLSKKDYQDKAHQDILQSQFT